MALINDFLSLIYPKHCEACGNVLHKHETYLCSLCLLNLPKGQVLNSNSNMLQHVFTGRIPVLYAECLYVFEKEARVQKILHAIKYQGQKELAEYLGKLFAKQLKTANKLHPFDLIIPTPLHETKLKRRGYNQSEWFAKGVASTLNIELDTISLYKNKSTETQTRKGKYERWQNVDAVFELKNENKFENKHVLLLDDVITTGATIEAAFLPFKNINGIKFSVGSIAFANKL